MFTKINKRIKKHPLPLRPNKNLLRRRKKLRKLTLLSKFLKKRTKHSTFDFTKLNFDDLDVKHEPFKIINVPTIFQDGKNQNIEKSISKLLKDYGIEHLDLSISATKSFSGHYAEHNVISMTFEEFVSYEGPHTIYLAQMPLFEKPATNKNKNPFKTKYTQKLKNLLASLKEVGQFCQRFSDRIERINLWYSKKETFSQLHYDSYDNFLFMIKGTKVFTLYPPNTKEVVCESIITTSYQQAKVIPNNNSNTKGIKIKVSPGEAIYLPQGWYHEVESYGDSDIIALNVWFNSIKDICQGREKYLLRYLLFDLIEKEVESGLKLYQEHRSIALEETNSNGNYIDYYLNKILNGFSTSPLTAQNLFTSLLFSVRRDQVRYLIHRLAVEGPNILYELLMSPDEWSIEFLTTTLEAIDNTPEEIMEQNQNYVSKDEFYNILFEKLDFPSVQRHFISMKKSLRKRVLEFIVKEKILQSYAF
jgi:Thermophilic glucose-6-phosphate isomerase and related metalloenzymes